MQPLRAHASHPAHPAIPDKLTVSPVSRGVISGAITSQYLLEKSRIVFQVGQGLLGPRVLGCAGGRWILRAWQLVGGWGNAELMNKDVCLCEHVISSPLSALSATVTLSCP